MVCRCICSHELRHRLVLARHGFSDAAMLSFSDATLQHLVEFYHGVALHVLS